MTVTHDETNLETYLSKYGKVEEIKPIKSSQGKKVAKKGYFISLYTNSSLEDSKFVEYCRKNQVIIQLDIFSEY